MKKSLIALAVLAASGATMAQSSVTLYGVADIWFGSVRGEETVGGVTTKDPSQTVLQDGGVSNSRFGFKGSEDLGGGLKANFQLEQGFSIDTGASTSAGFNRQAWVGFSGGFGEVQLGKAYNAFDDVSALAASVFDSDLAPINNVFVSTAFANAYSNTVKYATPNFGGFSGAVSMSLGENKDLEADGKTVSATKHSADSIYSISGKYENGPLAVALGYAKEKSTVPGADPVTLEPFAYSAKATRLAGTYDLGVAKLLATYGRVTEGDAKVTEYEIGADVPLSKAMTLSAGYARSKLTEPGMAEAKANSFGIAVAYSLSKRTTAYAGLNRTTGEQGADEAKASIYAIGVKHTF